MNAAARLVFASPKCDHIMPLLRQLHWLTVPWRIDYKLAVLVYKCILCLHGLAPSYLADELHRPAESELRRRLRSALSDELSVLRTRLSSYSDKMGKMGGSRLSKGVHAPPLQSVHAPPPLQSLAVCRDLSDITDRIWKTYS